MRNVKGNLQFDYNFIHLFLAVLSLCSSPSPSLPHPFPGFLTPWCFSLWHSFWPLFVTLSSDSLSSPTNVRPLRARLPPVLFPWNSRVQALNSAWCAVGVRKRQRREAVSAREWELCLPRAGRGEGWVGGWISPLTFFSCDCVSDEKANSVQDTSMICPGIKIENPDE